MSRRRQSRRRRHPEPSRIGTQLNNHCLKKEAGTLLFELHQLNI